MPHHPIYGAPNADLVRMARTIARTRGNGRMIRPNSRPDTITLDHSGVFFVDDDALVGTESVESVADSYSAMLASLAWLTARECPAAVTTFHRKSGFVIYSFAGTVLDMIDLLRRQWDPGSLPDAVGLTLCAASEQLGDYAVESEWRLRGSELVWELRDQRKVRRPKRRR